MSRRPAKAEKIQPINATADAQAAAVGVEDPPTPFDPAPAEAKPAAKPDQPPKKEKGDRVRSNLTFFDRVASIKSDEWGTRAKLKLYRLEPIIDRTRGSEFKFICIYHEPVDENKIKMDHGSGRYRLYLTFRAAGQKGDAEIDKIEPEILDPAFPPKIPPGEWVDDIRNKKWAWARPANAGVPPDAAPTQTAAGIFTDAIRTYSEVRKEVKEEMTPPASAEAKSDPFEKAMQFASSIMSMKADNPMVDIMKMQAQQSFEAAEKARQREYDMQKEMREREERNQKDMRDREERMRKEFQESLKTQEKPTAGTGLLKQMLSEFKEIAPAIKEIFPGMGEGGRSARTNWMDLLSQALPQLVDTAGKIGVALAARSGGMNGAAPPGPYPQLTPPRMPTPNQGMSPQAGTPMPANGAPPPGMPQEPTTEQRVVAFLQANAPAMMNYFRGFVGFSDEHGMHPADPTQAAAFAEWVDNGYGEAPMKDARAVGLERIMTIFRGAPAWPMIAPQEAKLVEFVDAVLRWEPTDDEDDEEEEGINLAEEAGL